MIQGFTSQSEKHKGLGLPIEDSFGFNSSRNIIVVADGVTRDPCVNLPPRKKEFVKNYPNPSPAAKAAEICTKYVREFLEKKRNLTRKDVMSALWGANDKIKEWNSENMSEPDYLTRDLAGCVASACVINRSAKRLYGGYVSDCGIAILGVDGRVKFKTIDEGPCKNLKQIEGIVKKHGGWNNPNARRIVRREIRNKPHCEYGDIGFGVLTGEVAALSFIKTFTRDVSSGDGVLVYSDGVEEVLFNSDGGMKSDVFRLFKSKNNKKIREYCDSKVKNEGTLVYTEI